MPTFLLDSVTSVSVMSAVARAGAMRTGSVRTGSAAAESALETTRRPASPSLRADDAMYGRMLYLRLTTTRSGSVSSLLLLRFPRVRTVQDCFPHERRR